MAPRRLHHRRGGIIPASQSVRARAVEVEGGSATLWSVWAFAVCAAPGSLPGYEMVEQSTVSTTGDKGLTKHAHFTKVEPKSSSAAVESIVDETGAPSPWVTHVQAICAFPYG